jgi:hypothetical protein
VDPETQEVVALLVVPLHGLIHSLVVVKVEVS